jgi:acyl-CoA synthetase (AMP-forming)/AMP-acid ligase II
MFTLREVPAELRQRYVRAGHWTDDLLGAVLDAGLARASAQPFSVRSAVRPWRGTLGDVRAMARRVAGGLRARGIGPGDAVAFQLPNWVEAAATFYAVALLGAVVVPVVHFYGPKELGYILRRTRVKALVTADRFGHLDYLANLERLRGDLPDLEWVTVVGDGAVEASDLEDVVPFDVLLTADAVDAPESVDPSSPALVAYTSGTTSDPKGVIHTHRSIVFEVKQLSGAQARGARPALVGAPVGHGIGMLSALLLPVWQGKPIHLIDQWIPKDVLAAMLEHGASAGAGATFFLLSLLDDPGISADHLALMHHTGLGGAAVPFAVAERATKLGISIVRMYGSTEHPSITGCTHDDPEAKRLRTDGRPLAGVELRLVDDGGRPVATGEPGEIASRGPDCFAGYTEPALNAGCFDADGWFTTGDIGVLDDDGFLAIVDRKKDIIIRGGENISALEVEELILRMDGVAEVAVVAAPDARLGEHAAAFLRLHPGAAGPELAAVRAQLEASGLARQKWPEEIHVVDDFARTPSGKIQKFVLRDKLTQASGTERGEGCSSTT